MGLGPTVKLTFAGDSKDLERKLKVVEGKTSAFGAKLASIGKGVAMLGAGGGAVNMIGGAVGAITALSGAAAAVPAVALAGAAAMNTFKLATSGFGEAVGAGLSGDVAAFAEATKKMHPEMAKAAATAVSFKPKVDALRKSVQGRFWDQFSVGIKKAGDTYLPLLTKELSPLSGELGNIAKQSLNATTTPFFTGAVSNILGNTTGMFREMRSVGADLLTGLISMGSIGSSRLGNLGDSIGNTAARFKTWATSFEGKNQIQAWISGGIAAFRQLGAIVGNIGSTVSSVFSGLGVSMESPLAAIEKITAKIAEFAASAEGQRIFAAIGAAAQAAGAILGSVFMSALTAIGATLYALAPVITVVANTLASWAPVLGPLIVGVYAANTAITAARTGFTLYNAALDIVKGKLVQTAITWVVEHAKMAAAAAVNVARLVATGAVWVASTVAQGAVALGSMIATGAAYVAQWVVMAAGAMARAVVMAAAWLVAMGPIGWVIAAVVGLVALVIANWDTVKGATVAAWNGIVSGVKAAGSAIVSGVKSFISGTISAAAGLALLPVRVIGYFVQLVTGGRVQGDQLVNFVRTIPSRVISIFSGFGSLLVNAGRSLIQGLWNGISSMVGWIVGNISGALGRIRNLFPFSPAKEGPFSGRGYTTYSGAALMEDFGAGMRSAEGDVRSAAATVVGGASSTLADPARGRGGVGAGAGSGVVVTFRGNTSDALATVIMKLIRENKIQIKAA